MGISVNSASGTIGDMNLKGSSFIAQDTTGIAITGNVNAESVVNSYENESKSTSKGFMSSKSSYKNSHAEENSASNLMLGENAVILGDVNSIGSNVVEYTQNLGQINRKLVFYLLKYSYIFNNLNRKSESCL